MIEKRTEHVWNILDENKEQIAWVNVINGDLTAMDKNLDTFEEYKEYHQALAEAIAIAEAQE